MAPTGAFTIVKSFLDPGSDVNSGAFRPLTVITPPGTIVNANPPAPCGGMVEVKYCVETAVMGALAQALDGKVAGDLKGGGNHCYVGGPDPQTGETFIFYEYPAGGTGGYDGRRRQQHGARVDRERHDHAPADRGRGAALPGARRGDGAARGLRRARAAGAAASASRARCASWRRTRGCRCWPRSAVLPPFGVSGGAAGACNRFWVRRGEQAIAALAAARQGERIPPGHRRRAGDGQLGRRRLRRSTRARPWTRSPPTSPRGT